MRQASQVAGLDVSGRTIPAQLVAELLRWIPFKDGSLAVVVGEVSGPASGRLLMATSGRYTPWRARRTPV